MFQTLNDLPAWYAARNQATPPEVERERDYFQSHREHVHYEAMATPGSIPTLASKRRRYIPTLGPASLDNLFQS